MSNNDNHIKLPCLKSIAVNNYALFKDNWTYEVKNGLNLFLGANGLGKTTTANLIIYGIVGAWQDENDNLHESYFTEREHEALKDHYKNQKPTVTIVFEVAASCFSVERYLSNPQIKQFFLDGELFDEVEKQNIHDVYVDKLKGCCLLDNIKDLSFILRKLLIREEEGNYLMWDRADQSKIIRLLFNPPGFFNDFAELEKKTTSALSMANRLRDFRGQFEKRKKVIEDQRDSIANNLTEGVSLQKLKSNLEDKTLLINTTQAEKDKLLEDILYMQNELKELDQSENTLSFEIDTINDELSQREKDFFGSIYHNPRMQLITHKLDRNHTCIICNNSKLKSDTVKTIINTINIQHHCPVCNESIRVSSDKNISPTEDDLNKLDVLRTKSKEKSNHLNGLIMKKKNIERPLSDLWKKNNEVEKQLNEYKLTVLDLKIAISQMEGESDFSSQYDRDILVLQKEIDIYNEEIAKEDKKYHKKKVLLENKNRDLNKRIDNISNKLNDIFLRYSKYFYLKDLRLTTSARQQRESKVQLTSFCPFFNDKRRMSIKQVSKSESIFLEYLFRIALIELFYHESNSLPFLILETSEGAFDLARTKQLANVLNSFCNNPFPYISITNLSKPQFVEALLTQIDSPRERLFNFIDHGAHGDLLEEQQKAELKLFKNELINLGLKDADPN